MGNKQNSAARDGLLLRTNPDGTVSKDCRQRWSPVEKVSGWDGNLLRTYPDGKVSGWDCVRMAGALSGNQAGAP